MPKSHKNNEMTHPLAYRGAWFYLFFSLILLIAIYPFFERPTEKFTPWILAFFNSIIVFAIIYAASTKRYQFWMVFGIGFLTLFFYWTPDFEVTHVALLVLRFLLYMYAIHLITNYLIYSKGFGVEDIYAAVSLYLLLGMTWAMIYEGIEYVQPGSFYYSEIQNIDGVLKWADFLYFSFVTITTLGYGDITPLTAVAHSMAILEAVCGLFCLGILVAGAIGRYVTMSVRKNINNL